MNQAQAQDIQRLPTWCTDTTSPNLTLRLFLTTLLRRILASSTVSSASTMHTVSFRFFPCMANSMQWRLDKPGYWQTFYGSSTLRSTVSPRKSCSVSMVLRLRATTELSSLTASSTMSRLGLFLRSKIAVLKSFLSAPFWLQQTAPSLSHRSPLLGNGLHCSNAYSSCAEAGSVDGPASAISVSDQEQRERTVLSKSGTEAACVACNG